MRSPTTPRRSTCSQKRRFVASLHFLFLSLSAGSLPVSPLQKALWEQQDPSDRRLPFIPKKYASLRQVPAFSRFIHERFERCLDLYLCPRQRKMRVISCVIMPPSNKGSRFVMLKIRPLPPGERQSRRSDSQTSQTKGSAAVSHDPVSGRLKTDCKDF